MTNVAQQTYVDRNHHSYLLLQEITVVPGFEAESQEPLFTREIEETVIL